MKRPSRPPRAAARTHSWLEWWPLFLVAAIVGGVVWLASGGGPTPSAASVTPTAPGRQFGGTADCRRQPAFLPTFGFTSNALLSSTDPRRMGLVLLEADANGEVRTFQHATWDDAGWLGGLALDERGHVYVVPAPRISLQDNPLADQTTLYRVDSETGELAPWLQLPAARPPSQSNPFGLMGLAYDCDTHSLYVASVAGSGRSEEVGRIYRLDLSGPTPVIAAQWEGVDAIGLGVFVSPEGRRLYFGSARTPEVRSLALTAAGDFVGPARVEFSLADYEVRGDDRARRLTFNATGGLRVDAVKFNYNLVASTETRQNLYQFQYDTATGRWQFLDVSFVNKDGS